MRTYFAFLYSTSLHVLLCILCICEYTLAQTITYKGLIFIPKEGSDSVLFVIPQSWDNDSGVNIPMEIKDTDGKVLPVAGLFPRSPFLRTWDRLKLEPLFADNSLYFKYHIDLNKFPKGAINNHMLYAILRGCKIVFPETVTYVPDELLSHYYDGLKIVLPKTLQNIYSEEGDCLVDKKSGKVVAVDFKKMERRGAGRVIRFPKTVTSFSGAALRGRIIASVEWPSQMTAIEPNSFEACLFTEDVTIPGHICRIGAAAFQRASGMGTVVLEEGVSSIDSMAFNENNLHKIVFPTSLKYIGRLAFSDCRSLKEIEGISAEHTSSDAFQSCYFLVNKTIPAAYHEKIEENNRIVIAQMHQTLQHCLYYLWTNRAASKTYHSLNAEVIFDEQGRLKYLLDEEISEDESTWFLNALEMGLISPYAWIAYDELGAYKLKMEISFQVYD